VTTETAAPRTASSAPRPASEKRTGAQIEIPPPAIATPTSASPRGRGEGGEQGAGGAHESAGAQQRHVTHPPGQGMAAETRRRGRRREQGGCERGDAGGGVEVGLHVHCAPALPGVLDEEGQRAQRPEHDERARDVAQRGVRAPDAAACSGGEEQAQCDRGDERPDEHEDELRAGARVAQRAGRQAPEDHAGGERAVGQAHHRAAGGRLAAHALGVDGDVDRAGRRPEDEQRGAQRHGRGRQPRQRRCRGEGAERRRQCRRAPPIQDPARQPHREQRARADAQQRHTELPIADARVVLHRRQRRSPAAPEGAEGGEAAQHPQPSRRCDRSPCHACTLSTRGEPRVPRIAGLNTACWPVWGHRGRIVGCITFDALVVRVQRLISPRTVSAGRAPTRTSVRRRARRG
jgi:hypothetical protein